MSAFKALRDVSHKFENELQEFSKELFSVKIGEKFEEQLVKKLRDIALMTSKLRMLRAKPFALTPQIKEQPHENALQEYGDAALRKVIEHVSVKSFTQAHAVKALTTASNRNLDPEIIERKEAIMENLLQFRHKEAQLSHLDALLKEREAEHAALRAEWDRTAGTLRDLRDQRNSNESGNRGPLYLKLSKLVDKLELMRWLVGRLVCARGSYDWLADPHRRLSALALTRAHNTVDMFTKEPEEQ